MVKFTGLAPISSSVPLSRTRTTSLSFPSVTSLSLSVNVLSRGSRIQRWIGIKNIGIPVDVTFLSHVSFLPKQNTQISAVGPGYMSIF